MANFISGIISLVLGIVMMSGVFITTVKNTNTSTWSAQEVALWSMVGLMGVIGILYGTAATFGLV